MPKQTDRAIKEVIKATQNEDNTADKIAKFLPLLIALLEMFRKHPTTAAMAKAAVDTHRSE